MSYSNCHMYGIDRDCVASCLLAKNMKSFFANEPRVSMLEKRNIEKNKIID